MINKLIHMIWVGKPMPDHLAVNVELWRRLHPEWILRVWGDEDFGWLKNQDYFDNAEKFVPADAVGQFKADIARYEILHQYGGFYADVDTYPLKPIDKALDGRRDFAAAEDSTWVGNTYLAAIPKHPVFEDAIKSLPNSIDTNIGARPCISTGPQFLTPIWRQHGCYIGPTEQWFPASYKDVRGGTWPEKFEDQVIAVHTWNHSKELMAKRRKR